MNTSACLASRSENDNQATVLAEAVRVCFVIDKLFPAGIELQLLRLIQQLDRTRVVPYLCLLDGTDRQTRDMEPKDCPVIRLGIQHLMRPSSLVGGMRLARFLRRERIDVVHPLFPDSLYFGAPVAKLAGTPCIVGFRVDAGYWMTPRDRWVGRLVYRLLDASVANCEACRRAVIADYGVARESVAIIPNGVDISRFVSPLLSGEGTGPDTAEQRVGIVANLRPVKNLELFVRVAARLAQSHPNVRFDIAGEGELRGELQSLIDALTLHDRVRLLGTVADIPKFLDTLDVAVLCSHSEGSPNAIMEYMAAGLPTVATDVGGNGEIVEDQQTGLLVSPGNEELLAAAIARLLEDRPLAARLGATARQRAFAEYSVEAQARRYEDFYCELAARKKRRK
jgi:glycosyltransferase involved in cell wall biosynthesis